MFSNLPLTFYACIYFCLNILGDLHPMMQPIFNRIENLVNHIGYYFIDIDCGRNLTFIPQIYIHHKD